MGLRKKDSKSIHKTLARNYAGRVNTQKGKDVWSLMSKESKEINK